jgi:hypothetical protein
MTDPHEWPAERTEDLRKHHAAGLSFKKLAALFGTTVGSIAGKCSRLKLVRTGQDYAAAGRIGGKISGQKRRASKIHFGRSSPAITPRPDRAAVAFVEHRDAPPLKPYEECVTFLDLKPHHCRFPVDGDGAMRYCGEDKLSESSYCLTHHIRAHRQ